MRKSRFSEAQIVDILREFGWREIVRGRTTALRAPLAPWEIQDILVATALSGAVLRLQQALKVTPLLRTPTFEP